MKDFNTKAHTFIHRYGFFIHFCLFFYILYIENIHPNGFMYYVFVINLLAVLYFNTIQSIAFGIKKTADILDSNAKEEERNKLN